MNLSRSAISYGLGGASAGTFLRLYVRIQLLWIIIWAPSDLFLVWYWSGRFGECGAHHYFGRWFLAWLFTQKLPLYFLSLPYRGRRCTIGSMYRYLNWRFYAGRSFGEWFSSYSLWAVIPASVATLALVSLLFRDPDDPPQGRRLRGLQLIPPRRLSRELRRTAAPGDRRGIELAGVWIPRSTEIEHVLITGATGAGKSMAIRSLLRQAQARGDLAVVVDPECEYVSEFYRVNNHPKVTHIYHLKLPHRV